MRLRVSLVILLLLFQISGGNPTNVIIESGTLVLVGFTSSAAVLAADSAVVTNGKIVRSNAQKIIPVGRFGAVLIAGATRIGSAAGEVSLYDFVDQCARASADISSAEECVSKFLKAILPKKMNLLTRQDLIVGFYFAGYVKGERSFQFLEVTRNPKTGAVKVNRPSRIFPSPGFLIGFGRNYFALSAISGKVPELLNRPQLKLLRERDASGTRKEEMASLLMFLLEETETELARKYDPVAFGVGPPNRLTIIDASQGISSVQ